MHVHLFVCVFVQFSWCLYKSLCMNVRLWLLVGTCGCICARVCMCVCVCVLTRTCISLCFCWLGLFFLNTNTYTHMHTNASTHMHTHTHTHTNSLVVYVTPYVAFFSVRVYSITQRVVHHLPLCLSIFGYRSGEALQEITSTDLLCGRHCRSCSCILSVFMFSSLCAMVYTEQNQCQCT